MMMMRAYSLGQWGAILARLRSDADDALVEGGRDEISSTALAALPSNTTTLIIADAAQGHQFFSDAIASLGCRSITVHHPLDAVIGLRDHSLVIGAVLAPARDTRFSALEFFAFVRDAFPLVRRIAYAEGALEQADAPELPAIALTYPVPLDRLAEVLQRPREAPPAGMPPPSVLLQDDARIDQRHSVTWTGADRRTCDELDRRYRPRIGQLALALGFSDEDAEDIAQETLLALFLGPRTLTTDSASGDLISGLVGTSARACLRAHRGWARLLLALASAAAADRLRCERSRQPDEDMLGAELAACAGAAVGQLPGQCGSVFWLCAVEGQSSREAGTTLGVTSSRIEGLLLRARRLIADRMHTTLA